jgi:serine/threonine-protein kinase
MVTGKLPFFSKDATELARLHKEVIPISTRNFNPQVPLTLDQIILKVLSKEQTNRYRTADQFGRVLENLKESYKINSLNNQSSALDESPLAEQKLKISPYSTSFEKKESGTFDWKTALLALLAFLLAGGLIPFWLYIWFSLNSGR